MTEQETVSAAMDAIVAQQVKVAELRGKLGRMRAKVVKARNLLLSTEHIRPVSGVERDALTLLCEALRDE